MSKWCLVTGASGGIGAALAREAAEAGFDLILSARRLEPLEALAAELRAMGVEVVVVSADLSQSGAGEALWQEASAGREIEVLINNAGFGLHGGLHDPACHPGFQAMLSVNDVAASALLMRACADMGARGHGCILNVASIAAFMPGPGMAVYHASKAYLLSLSEAASAEMRGHGVRISALCPGPTDTGFFDEAGINGTRMVRLFPKMAVAPVARAGWRGLKAGKPVIVPGGMNKALIFLLRLAPRRVVTWLSALLWQR